MRLNRLPDVIGIAVLEFVRLEGLFGQAASLRAIFDAAGLRKYGKVIQVALEICERGAGALEIKLCALFAQGRWLNVGALRAAGGSKRQDQCAGSGHGESPPHKRCHSDPRFGSVHAPPYGVAHASTSLSVP
jgi:hypothetical protein